MASLMSAAAKSREITEAGDRRWDAEHYRERARTLRELALRTKSPEVRRDLIELALQHERLAHYVETYFHKGGGNRSGVSD
jgi:hypothetical protein